MFDKSILEKSHLLTDTVEDFIQMSLENKASWKEIMEYLATKHEG